MWLPHGLATGVTPASLAPLITICRPGDAARCEPLPFSLSRPEKGILRASVPGLEPRQRYRIDVKGDAAVKDGFGLPLQVRARC